MKIVLLTTTSLLLFGCSTATDKSLNGTVEVGDKQIEQIQEKKKFMILKLN